MLTRNINYDGFEYVIENQKPAKICFGSGKFRECIAIKPNNTLGPWSYNVEKYSNCLYKILSKPRSTKGIGFLASKAPRLPSKVYTLIPSPTKYNIRKKYSEPRIGLVPFGSKVKRGLRFENDNPGPGTYNVSTQKCSHSKTYYNFGNVQMIPATECKCVPTLCDECSKCTKFCDTDYWHNNHTIFLCHPCMVEEKRLHEIYTESTLRQFKKIRNCTFKHRHEKTTAGIRLLTDKKIQRKEQIENYLDSFMKCFSF